MNNYPPDFSGGIMDRDEVLHRCPKCGKERKIPMYYELGGWFYEPGADNLVWCEDCGLDMDKAEDDDEEEKACPHCGSDDIKFTSPYNSEDLLLVCKKCKYIEVIDEKPCPDCEKKDEAVEEARDICQRVLYGEIHNWTNDENKLREAAQNWLDKHPKRPEGGE